MGAAQSRLDRLLRKELDGFRERPMEGFSAPKLDDNDIRQWPVTFHGLKDTPSEGKDYHAIFRFPQSYPKCPPTVTFLSKINHPEVSPDGKVSASILRPPPPAAAGRMSRSSPTHTVDNIAKRILAMLSSPIDEPPPPPSAKARIAVVIHRLSVVLHMPASCAATKSKDHKLELQSSSSTQQQLFRCDGCKQQGSGPRFICRNHGCNYELHKECMSPKQTEIYDFFGDREYRFFRKPQEKKGCRVCGKDILGFNYQSVDKEKWALHPCCAKLPKKLPVQEALFELREKMKGECIWCREKKENAKARGGSGGGVPGWGYASRCGDYHFHVHCLMEMFHNNASVKDLNMELSEIKLEQLAKKKSKKKWGGGKHGTFSTIVTVLVNAIASILLGGDATFLVLANAERLLKG